MSILAFLRLAGGSVMSFLGKLNLAQLVCITLAALALVQHFIIADARHDRDSYKAQRDYYKQQLDAIFSKRDEQKIVTRDNIKIVERTIHDADGKAKEVEREPIPPTECHGVTPSGVRQADL